MEEKNNREHKTVRRRKLNRTLDTVGCGLFFIWTGIAVLADLGWGVGFIGVGILILGLLAARKYLSGPDGSKGSRCHWCRRAYTRFTGGKEILGRPGQVKDDKGNLSIGIKNC